MIRKLLGWIFNAWVLVALLLLALSLLVWIVGPLVAIGEKRPLETELSRWLTIGVLFATVLVIALWRAWRARRGNSAVVAQLVAAPASAKEAESPDLLAVRQRFERALQVLQQARFGGSGLVEGWRARLGGRYLYELPWYLIIGAPGSGKTTALRHSGLEFPLAEAMGEHAVRGVGGTRDCDWWFTDRAVLIDTAGRFTTQDSNRETDRGTWNGFLAMLHKARPRQPVNGVLVTVSVTDLLTASAAERAQHAATVRQRLQELHEQLGIRFPIYLLVSKTDLLAGFSDYFATLDKEQRAAPWGWTLPLDSVADAARFGAEFDALQQRLVDGLIDRLQLERDPQRRALIYGFPSQFAVLRSLLGEFAGAVFSPSRFEAQPMLRGVYFISGTQEGTPIDRVLGAVARSYRLERAILPPLQASGRSFFLNRLLGEVVFAESGLAGTNLRWERRRGMLALGGYAALALLGGGLLVVWGTSYVGNRRYVDEVAGRVDEVRRLVQATPNRASPDLLPVLPALEATRRLALADDSGAVPWSRGFGLFQGAKLDSAARGAYERMLVDAVLPRLALRIEEQLRQGDSAEGPYEALKAYVMLHDPQHFDAAALTQHVAADWDLRLRELSTEQRQQLDHHLERLLAQGAVTSPLAQDKTLLDNTRLRLATVPLPQRIYQRMRRQQSATEFPEFSITRAAGNNAALVLVRSSGQPLTKGVPGFYTYDGYHRGFQNQVDELSQQLADEQPWVLGVAATPRPAATVAALTATPVADDVRRLYLTDYATLWEAFIADIRIQPMTSLAQSVQVSRLLSAPDSPLPPLLRAISRETTLAAAPKTALGKAESSVREVVKGASQKVAKALGEKPAVVDPGARIEKLVDDRFTGLRALVSAPEGGKAPIDDTVALIGEVHLLLNAVETAIKGGAAPPASPVPNKVKSEAARLPEPVRSMLDTLSQGSAKVSQIMVRQTLGQEVRSQVGEFCQQAVAGRYPLARSATRDATQADFALLFGPGGKIDQLFQQKLAPYVDTSTRPWRFRPVEGTPLGADAGTLPQFQRAAAIRETFFPAGAAAPTLRLEFKPVDMDQSLSQFVLDIDGQIVRYAHGPQIPTAVQWPGPRGSSQVRVQISPPGAGNSGMITDGPWALFRMFDRVRIDNGPSPERFRATFEVDGRKAVFDVTTSSVRNPFRLPELAEFSCPGGL